MIPKIEYQLNSGITFGGAGGTTTVEFPRNKRYNVIYTELRVTKAAGGAGVTSLPLLSDIAGVISLKIGGVAQRTRTAITMAALNKLQDNSAAGKVEYWQAGALVATVLDATNKSSAGLGLAANTDTLAVFTLPMYLAEFYRVNKGIAEALALPTQFSDGSIIAPLTLEINHPGNAAAGFSGHALKVWVSTDELIWPAKSAGGLAYTDSNKVGQPFFVKHSSWQKQYSAAGKFNIAEVFAKRDRLLQFSVSTDPADPIAQLEFILNGKVIRNIYKAWNDQRLVDMGMNPAGILPNRFDVVFDLNDDPSTGIALKDGDELEVNVYLATANAANKTLTVDGEYYGQPN